MGVRGLEKFVRTELPNGCKTINIRTEIRNFKDSKSPPTIVIDFQSLFEPVCMPDLGGILCGGRYELGYQIVDRFLKRLQQLGVSLVFFNDGPMKNPRKLATWIDKHNEKYDKQLRIIDAVDNGDDLRTLVHRHRWNIPHNTQYPVKILAKQYGQFRVSVTGDSKKEMTAYANSVNALAIISNNTDFLIFKGDWRFWSSKDLNFENLTTREFNRDELRRHLGLDGPGEMALLAALASNNGFIKERELELFNRRCLERAPTKIHAIAEFVRRPHGDLIDEIFGQAGGEGDLRERFQEGLDYYGTDYNEQERLPSQDQMLDFLKDHGKAFLYKMWIGFPIHFGASFVDFREDSIGAEYPELLKKLVLREAAITVYHRRDHPDHTSRKLIYKKTHENGYTEECFPLEFPQHVEPPNLRDMLSRDPEVHAKYADTKLQLYSWIISDKLDYHQLESIPPKLMPTVAVIYFLIEQRVIEPFEADLLLQVAHDVVFKKYDLFQIRYPQNLNSRAFRVAFLYIAICKHVMKALNVVGLDTQEYPSYPQFDGVRFHNLYRDWARGEGTLEQIQQWRIYEHIV